MSIIDVQKRFEKEIGKAVKKELHSEKKNFLTNDVLIPNNYQLFNKMIGYPTSKILNKPQQMTWYQILLDDIINNFHKVNVNKSRKIGITEAALRSIAMNVFGRYQGHDILLIAGNKFKIAKENLIRFDELFQDKRGLGYSFKESGKDGNIWHYKELIRRSNLRGDEPEIEFRDGTRVMAFAASKSEKSQPSRGPDDVACILFTEASHAGMKQDQPIMNALLPNLANRDDGDFILESTPNGRRGFFYNSWMNSMKILSKEFNMSVTDYQKLVDRNLYLWQNNKKLPSDLDWFPLMFGYMEGIKARVLSEKFIKTEKRNPSLDFDQEYCCKFTSTYTQAIDTSNLQKLPPEKAEKESQDLLTLIGKKSVQ